MHHRSTTSRWRKRLAGRASAVLAALALVTLMVATGASADGRDRPKDATLLRTYQPVLVFHPAEPFRPNKIQPFVQDSELERFIGSSPAQLPFDAFWAVVDPDPEPGELPAPAPGAFYRLDQSSCEADAPLAGRDCYAAAAAGRPAAVYGRVVHTRSRIVLQYWLFYYDNPLLLPPTPVGTFWQSHEGDWEVVNVVLGTDGTPVEAAETPAIAAGAVLVSELCFSGPITAMVLARPAG